MGEWYDIFAIVVTVGAGVLLLWPSPRVGLNRSRVLFVGVFIMVIHHWLMFHLAEHISFIKDYTTSDRALYVALPVGFFVGGLISCLARTAFAGLIFALSLSSLGVSAMYFFGSWAFLAVPITAIALGLVLFGLFQTSVRDCLQDEKSVLVYGLSGVLYMLIAFVWVAALRFVILNRHSEQTMFDESQWEASWYGIWAGVNVARIIESIVTFKMGVGLKPKGGYEELA